jgi:hypothetical protein
VAAVPAGGEARRRFDVVLSYNRRDGQFVERIAERLKRERLEPWLDAWQLVPGVDWKRGLADSLAASGSCAVFVSVADPGAWQNQEVSLALDRAAADPEFRLFLVLLPGLPDPYDPAELQAFLSLRTWVDYREGLDDERAYHALVCAIRGLPLGPSVPLEADADVCPYRGLEVFEEEHAEFFFGRDADVQRLLERLKRDRFLAVLGASGSGKSSLVRAGLLPELRREGPSAAERWEIVTMRPGARPLEALAARLAQLGGGRAMQQTLDELAADQRTPHLAASLALTERPRGTRLLLLVDQFEEVFTLCRDEAERAAFFANLLEAAMIPDGPTVVLPAMRADFYHRCGAYPELFQRLAAGQYGVSPLQPEGLRQAVEEPARRVGLAFEPGLVATILDRLAQAARLDRRGPGRPPRAPPPYRSRTRLGVPQPGSERPVPRSPARRGDRMVERERAFDEHARARVPRRQPRGRAGRARAGPQPHPTPPGPRGRARLPPRRSRHRSGIRTDPAKRREATDADGEVARACIGRNKSRRQQPR